jgi:hypothetical protein
MPTETPAGLCQQEREAGIGSAVTAAITDEKGGTR